MTNPKLNNSLIGDMNVLLQDLSDRGLKCNSILDIGANSGEWSRQAKKVFKDSNFFLIEPLKEMEEHLLNFCKDNPGSKYFLYAAGSQEEKLYITLGGENLTGSNLTFGENEFLKAENKQREIQVMPIDALIEKGELPLPEFVKVDVQGFELEALKGGSRLFENAEVFILEVNFFEFMKGVPLVHEVVLFMAEKGFVIYDFPGFLRRPYDGALAQMDICFVKKEGVLRDSNLWS